MTHRALRFLCVVPAALVASVSHAAPPAIDRADFDAKVGPCADFYRHATGGWQDRHPIPPEFAIFRAFEEVAQRNQGILKELAEGAARGKHAAGTPERLVGDFYAAGMDEAQVEKLGTTPLREDEAAFASIRSPAELARALAEWRAVGAVGAFRAYVDLDDKDATKYIVHLQQAGLGLPDRDYYTRTDAKSVALQGAYRAHIERLLVLAGSPEAQAKTEAASIYALEERLARAQMTLVEQRDPDKVYNKLTLEALMARAPGFPWDVYFKTLGVPPATPLNVRQPAYLEAVAKAVSELPLATWALYLRWTALQSNTAMLPKRFAEAAFEFYGKTLTGAQVMQPRWRRVLEATDRALGEALGRLYVERAFPPAAKRRMLTLVADLRAALGERIDALPWMSAATKAKAKQKLDTIMVKIGYPDQWRDYSGLAVSRKTFLANVRAARRFDLQRTLKKLGGPVDRTEWGMSPPTVNAYYNPTLNEIVFPAGILQPPFFYQDADDAVNYGAIGMVIGHELTHGYDDEGRRYDAHGNLTDWWTPEDAAAFDARAAKVVAQFDAYEALPGLRLNGKLTLGENIADLGGLKIAYAALERALARGGKAEPIDGLRPAQRFFLAYAQAWHGNVREPELRNRVATDPHAPAKYRVNGPLANLPEFHGAFGCQPGDAMVRPAEDRPQIW